MKLVREEHYTQTKTMKTIQIQDRYRCDGLSGFPNYKMLDKHNFAIRGEREHI
jgi:hypothetical protein